ncbi:hypothetical protein JOC86_003118 [Bacillus pakistanensis]|uniref:DUF1850 domain-containing protein n=1 Tax=Rossellomorea pakistanensis TaxID=992288 RepID=A0ABS2NFD9_9BACI|nr:DUF1850 domain-containing protein [Bacillus pakistanensis]MBM7586566.1 hypothetical protein [Bacillus pakistanensis]
MKVKLIFIFFILLACLSVIILFPFKTYLVIESRNNPEDYLFLSIEKEKEFAVFYTHSIHKSLVEEWYALSENDRIKQTKLVYEDTAIGMPSNSESGGEFVRTDDGKYVIENINRTFTSINMRIGQVIANHKLVFRNNLYEFSEYFPEGSVVTIKAKKISLWQKWKGVKVDE